MIKNEMPEEIKYSRAKRAREISAILIKYGFEIAVVDIIPSRIKKVFRKNEAIIIPIPIYPKLVTAVKGSPKISSLNIYRRFRLAIQELGPVFVKFGQILGTRQESLPPELIKELKLLNSNVEAVPFREIKPTIERYTGSIQNSFSFFNEKSFAAASLSQEYLAKLKDGTDVVLKVQRPEIREKVAIDLSILKYLAKRSKSFNDLKIYNLSGIIEDFSKQITAELDFVRDGKNAEILAVNMKGMEGIHIPKIYWEFSGRRLLVMEYIEGVRIDDLSGLKKMGIDTRKIALNGLHAYLKQIFQDGFFHGDPHSGNLLVMKNGDIAFLDFGLIGVLRPEKRDLLLRMLMGVINSDVNDLTRVFVLLGITIKDEWIDLFKDDLYVSLMEGKNESFDSKKPDTDAFVGITNTLRKYRLQVPVTTMLMIKVIMMVGDYIATIDPEFNFLDEIKPYLGKIVRNSVLDSAKSTILSLPDAAHEMSQVPRSLNDASRQISNGSLFVRLSNSDVDRLGNYVDRAVNKIIFFGSLMFIIGFVLLYFFVF